MLPKPDKSKKSISGQQLDLVETIDSQDKILKKRRFIVFFLIITVGVSFSFFIYRQAKHIFSQPIKLSAPKINLNLSLNPVNQAISNSLSKSTQKWSVYIQDLSKDNQNWNYRSTFNQEQADAIIKSVESAQFVTISSSPAFPAGTQFKESMKTEGESLIYDLLAYLPNKIIYYHIVITGPNSQTESQMLLPKLFESTYWKIIEN